jgi:hypothetical protein
MNIEEMEAKYQSLAQRFGMHAPITKDFKGKLEKQKSSIDLHSVKARQQTTENLKAGYGKTEKEREKEAVPNPTIDDVTANMSDKEREIYEKHPHLLMQLGYNKLKSDDKTDQQTINMGGDDE